jgi:Aminopeptidase N
MTFDVAVTTPADQLPVAPGVLVSSTVADGRRTSCFRATHPVSAFFALAAARYHVERVRHGDVEVEVYVHPGHRRNVPRVLEAATAALDLCVARYGPYPLPQLRIAEVPDASLRAGGFALPGVVFLAERRGFLIDTEAPGASTSWRSGSRTRSLTSGGGTSSTRPPAPARRRSSSRSPGTPSSGS